MSFVAFYPAPLPTLFPHYHGSLQNQQSHHLNENQQPSGQLEQVDGVEAPIKLHAQVTVIICPV